MVLIGIDPGVNTGIAFWDKVHEHFTEIRSLPIHKAMRWVIDAHRMNMLDGVVFEDARLRTGYFGKNSRAKAQGAGSVKRDCSIWEEFLTDSEIKFTKISPRDKGAKVDAARFKALTGWEGQTNEHGRDAAMLVFGR